MLVQEHAWNCACDVLLMIRMPGLSRCIARERKVESKAEKLHKSRLAVGCRVDKHFPFEQREMWAVRASRNAASNSRFTRRSSYQTFLLCIQLYYFAKLHCIGLIFSHPKNEKFSSFRCRNSSISPRIHQWWRLLYTGLEVADRQDEIDSVQSVRRQWQCQLTRW